MYDLKNLEGLHILVAPLNWGLGHATRSAALIERLRIKNTISLASDGLAYEWMKREFPDLPIFRLNATEITYKRKAMWQNAIIQLPVVLDGIRKDRREVDRLTDRIRPNLIISDHRLGFYSRKVKSVLLAHQLYIPHRNLLLAKVFSYFQKTLIGRFDECWVPDYGDGRLSGQLSSLSLSINKKFIGPLSHLESDLDNKNKYDLSIVLSGPEPQRSNLEEKILTYLDTERIGRIALVRGTNIERSENIPRCIDVYDLLDSKEVGRVIRSSQAILCRSGYSTVMDLSMLQKKAIFVPTPNHPEQEYLAAKHRKESHAKVIAQSDISHNSVNSAVEQLLNVSK